MVVEVKLSVKVKQFHSDKYVILQSCGNKQEKGKQTVDSCANSAVLLSYPA